MSKRQAPQPKSSRASALEKPSKVTYRQRGEATKKSISSKTIVQPAQKLKTSKEYQEFLYKALEYAFPREKRRDPKVIEARKLLVSPEAMVVWERARTHSSYNPNRQQNFEMPEHLGDRILGAVLTEELVISNPNITEEELTLMGQKNLFKAALARLCENLTLDKYILTLYNVSTNTREDAMEAFVAGLFINAEKFLGQGYGFILCQNFIVELFGLDGHTFDLSDLKNAKIKLKEIIEGLRWQSKDAKASVKVLGEPYQTEKGWRVTYVLPPSAIRWLRDHGHRVSDDYVIADVLKPYKNQALDEAAEIAVHNLETKFGLRPDHLRSLRAVPRLPKKIQEAMKKDGYTSLEIQNVTEKKDEENARFWQLIGTDKDGYKTIILTLESEEPLGKTQQEEMAYELFLEGPVPQGSIIKV